MYKSGLFLEFLNVKREKHHVPAIDTCVHTFMVQVAQDSSAEGREIYTPQKPA